MSALYRDVSLFSVTSVWNISVSHEFRTVPLEERSDIRQWKLFPPKNYFSATNLHGLVNAVCVDSDQDRFDREKIWTTGPKVSPNIDRSSFYRCFHVTWGQLDFWLPLTDVSLSSFCFCRCGFIQGPLLTLWRTFFSFLSTFFFGLLCVEVIFLCFLLIIILFYLELHWVMFSLLHVSFRTARAAL